MLEPVSGSAQGPAQFSALIFVMLDKFVPMKSMKMAALMHLYINIAWFFALGAG